MCLQVATMSPCQTVTLVGTWFQLLYNILKHQDLWFPERKRMTMMENAWECHSFRASTTWTPGKAGSSGILRPGLVHLEPLHGQFVSGREIHGNLMIMRMRMKMIVVVAAVLRFLAVPVLVQVLFVPTCMILYVLIVVEIVRYHEISWDIMRYYYIYIYIYILLLWMSCSSIHSWYRWLLELPEVILGAAVHGEFHGATLPRYVWLRWALLGFLLAEGAEPDEHLRTWGKMDEDVAQCRGNVVAEGCCELTVACWDLKSCPTDRPCHGKTMLLGVHLPLSPQKLLGIGQSSTRKWVAYG